jgi:hypothetical protein
LGFSQPKIQVREGTNLDFGPTLVGKKAVRDVTVLNIGKDTLHIDYVKAQCGCTATGIASKIIAPHDSSKLNITFNTTGYPRGKVSKYVSIMSDDTTTGGVTKIIFTTDVTEGIVIDPKFMAFNNAKVDSEATESITIGNGASVPIHIESVSTEAFPDSVASLKVSVDKKDLKPGDRAILSVTYHPHLSGQYHTKILVHTDFKDQPDAEAPLMLFCTRK